MAWDPALWGWPHPVDGADGMISKGGRSAWHRDYSSGKKGIMSTVWLPAERPRLNRKTQRDVTDEKGMTGSVIPRIGQLATRDHRDDGSAIGGLLIGLTFGVLAWALIIALLVALR